MHKDLIENVAKLYEEEKCIYFIDDVKIGNSLRTRGIKQGCKLSPTIFNIVINRVINQLNKVFNYQCRLNALFYADDALILAENAKALKMKINVAKNEMAKLGLKMNEQKCEIIVFGKRDGEVKEEMIAGIRVVKQIKYLGVKIEDSRDIFSNYTKEKINKARKYKYWINFVLRDKIFKADLGKVFWKGALLPSILHGSQVCVWKKKQINEINILQNNILRNLLNLPQRAPNAYIKGEIGISNQHYRDIKNKLTLLQHILKNTVTLRRLVEEEWDKGHPWLEQCKDYLKLADLNLTMIENMSRLKLKNIINKIEKEEWLEEMKKKKSLCYYRLEKKEIGKSRMWRNNKEERVVRMFQSGAVGYGLIGKECEQCGEENSVEHVLRRCEKFKEIREEFGVLEGEEMVVMMQLRGENGRWGAYVNKIYDSLVESSKREGGRLEEVGPLMQLPEEGGGG
jgi:hypothetical protein